MINNDKNKEKSRKRCFQFIKSLPQKPLPTVGYARQRRRHFGEKLSLFSCFSATERKRINRFNFPQRSNVNDVKEPCSCSEQPALAGHFDMDQANIDEVYGFFYST